MRPFSMSGIDAVPERLDAGALKRIDEQLVGARTQVEIGGGDVLDHVGDLGIGHSWADQRAELGMIVGLAAERDLIKLLAVLLDAQNADVADVMMAAGIDAARNVDVHAAEVALAVEIAEAPRQLLGDGDRARIGEAAVIEPRTGDDVGDESDVRNGETKRIERAPDVRQIALRHVRQRQVLLVADADFAERVAVGNVGERVHLHRRRVARRAAFRFQRDGDDGVARLLVIVHRIVDPAVELRIGVPRRREFGRAVLERLVIRIDEAAGDLGDHGRIERQRPVLDGLPLGFDFLGERLRAEIVHQDLDACLPNIASPASLRCSRNARSWMRKAARSWAAVPTQILNLRGMKENSGCSVTCWRMISAQMRGSSISSGATPAHWSVVMLRTLLPLVCMPCMPTSARSASASGISSSLIQWN